MDGQTARMVGALSVGVLTAAALQATAPGDGVRAALGTLDFDPARAALVDREYRTQADRRHRVVAGLSEGGFGATNLAARHPDVFGSAVSLSGYFHARGPVFGADPAVTHANSPDVLVSEDRGARSVRYLLVAGDRDPRYLAEARSFAAELDRLGVPNRLIVVAGAHEGGVWTGGLAQALRQVQGDQQESAT